MKGFADFLTDLEEYNTLLSNIHNNITPINVVGAAESQKAHLIYSLHEHTKRPCLVVTYNDVQAKKMYEDLSFFFPEGTKLFSSKEFIFYDIEASSTDILQKRMGVIDDLCKNNRDVILITTIDVIQQMMIPKSLYMKYIRTFEVGNVYDIEQMIQDFIVMGYQRVDTVEGRGQFAVRGGIVDIFPMVAECPYRIEFFDDEIDSIREFDVITQLSIEKVHQVYVGPAREIIYDYEQAEHLTEQLKKIIEKLEEKLIRSGHKDILHEMMEHIEQDIQKIQQQHYFHSLDKYLPLVYAKDSTVLQYFDQDVLILLDEPSRVKSRSESYEYEFGETIKTMLEKGMVIEESGEAVVPYSEVIRQMNDRLLIGVSALSSSSPEYRPKKMISLTTKTLHSFHGKMEFLLEDLKLWQEKKYRVIILSGTKNRGEKLVESFNAEGMEGIYLDSKDIDKSIPRGKIIVTGGSLHKGFEYPLIQLAIISDKEIFGQNRKISRKKALKSPNKIKAFTDLSVGDYVVHQIHGIGKYIGIEQLVVEGVTKDYLKIQYKGGDYLYVPTNQLDLIQKYIGSEDKPPKLNKLGGTDWNKVKNKVRKSVEDLAKGLIELYAARQTIKGYGFSKDTPWQRQFEDTFPYEETADQLRCIEEVKKDMEQPRPMDRLLCGDVGYGKTEVAIRAAFKSVMDGKQVAYLVPTTILAQQHYNNFVQRMKDFPIKIEMLSRFRSPAEQKNIIKGIKTGEIDIVIGTHRILQKDLQFKDLGLLIIDEEQRFVVTHKEKLKSLKQNVDVLTLTATPIPRTLHMSMLGIRDMSIIEEPPEDRYPVQTYVLEYNPSLIQDAIIRELNRGGQVYYLFNRVKGIQKVAQDIQQMVPEAKVVVGHGQMSENELEEVMMKVLNGEADILVCTTIIETGLDIPNVNTIIIEDADKLGLAQLYQLRGRVGRSNRIAYAYLTYKKDKVLHEAAEKRLRAIKEFTEFGSGFKIAMRDLEIRGAGNILGPEQHGHMEAVGYDTYCKLLEEAVRKLKGEPVQEELETTVDLNVDAYIPETYIKNHNQRIEIYKKIAAIENLQDAYDVEEEIEDRYGDLPQSVRNLLDIALIKSLGNDMKISEITQKGNNVLIQFYDAKQVDMNAIIHITNQFNGNILFTASDRPYLTYKHKNGSNIEMVKNIKTMLQELKKLQM